MEIDITPPTNPEVIAHPKKSLHNGLNEVYEIFDRSGAVDVMELKEDFRNWNQQNYSSFDEDDDLYFSLIDDFLSRCGRFESFASGPKADRDKKESEMSESIELQRQLIQTVASCTEIDAQGNINITDREQFDRVTDTMVFLDRVVKDILTKPQLKSSTSQGAPYLSGLKSMICASVMARGAGYSIEFGPVNYDIRNDLDMILKKDNLRLGLDVTTKQVPGNSNYGFSFYLDDNRTLVNEQIAKELNLTHRSKLLLPSSGLNPNYYDADARKSKVGLPSSEMLRNFRRAATPR